jgi:hypothetical protein
MKIYILFSIVIIIIILFYFLNIFYKKKYNENFELEEDNLLCGTDRDVCKINEFGLSSCCDGFVCVRKEGNFEYKICVNKDKLANSDFDNEWGLSKYVNTQYIIHGLNIPKLEIKDYSNLICCNSLFEYFGIYIDDIDIIKNINFYLDGLKNIENNQLILDLKLYLDQLTDKDIINKPIFEDYIKNIDIYSIPNCIILENINVYINTLVLPNTSLFNYLKNYLNSLNIIQLYYEKYLNKHIFFNDKNIQHYILLYLNSPNIINSAGISSLKDYINNIDKNNDINILRNSLNGINLSDPPNNNICTNINNYLNILNLQNDSKFIYLKNYFSTLNFQINIDNVFDTSIINNLKEYLNSLKIVKSPIIESIKNYFNIIKDNTQIVKLQLYLNSLFLFDWDTPSIVITMNIKNYLNQIKLTPKSLLNNFKDILNINLTPVLIGLQSYDNYVIKNILDYLNTLNLYNNLLVNNLQSYLIQLNINNSIDNFNNLKNYINNFNGNMNNDEIKIIANINNYLNAINFTSVSVLNNLKFYFQNLNLNLNNNIDINNILLNSVIVNSLKLYIKSINIPDNISLQNFKNYLNQLNSYNIVKLDEIGNYLKKLNTNDIPNNIILTHIKNYFNIINTDNNINSVIDNLKRITGNINIGNIPKFNLDNYFNKDYNLNFLTNDFWKNIVPTPDINNLGNFCKK